MKSGPLVAAIVIALITHLCLVYGLIAILPFWLAAAMVGAVIALVSAQAWRTAGLGALAGLALGSVIAEPWFLGDSHNTAIVTASYVAVATLTAGAVAAGLAQSHQRAVLECRFALFFITITALLLWATTLKYNEGGFTPDEPTVNAWLSTPPQLGHTPTDRDLYLRLFYDTHNGVPYYDAYAQVYRADPLGEFRLPNGVPGYRLPTLFKIWQLLPAQGSALVPAFLLFATLALASAYAIGTQLVGYRAGLLGALLVAAAYLNISTSTFVVFVDGWAMAITLAGVALFIASVQKKSRALLWASVAVMLLAASMREILLYPMLLAAASALLLPREQWRKAISPWLVGIGVFALIYAAHTLAIAGRVDKSGSVGFWLNGGLAHLVATQRFFEQLLGGAPLFVPVMVAAGLAGAVLTVRRNQRLGAFLTAAVLIPHVTFLFFGSAGRDMITGAVPGYWGMLVVPIALALAPVAINRALLLNEINSSNGN